MTTTLTEPYNRRKGDLYDRNCPSRLILDHVTSRWGILILIALLDGTHRFSELGRRVAGVSEKMLAQTLQTLESDGFIVRTVYATIPPKVEYGLTPLGVGVAGQVNELANWVEKNLPKVLQYRTKQ